MIDAGKKGRRARTRPSSSATTAPRWTGARDSRSGSVHRRGLARAISANVAERRRRDGARLGEPLVDVVPRPRERFALRRAGASGAGLVRSASLGGGGASRSFVFGASEGGRRACGARTRRSARPRSGRRRRCARLAARAGADSTWVGAARRRSRRGPARPRLPARQRGGISQSLFGMLEASQDWDEVLGKGDSLARGVKAAKNVRLRAVPRWSPRGERAEALQNVSNVGKDFADLVAAARGNSQRAQSASQTTRCFTLYALRFTAPCQSSTSPRSPCQSSFVMETSSSVTCRSERGGIRSFPFPRIRRGGRRTTPSPPR